MLFRARRRTGWHHARDDAPSAPAGTTPADGAAAPQPADGAGAPQPADGAAAAQPADGAAAPGPGGGKRAVTGAPRSRARWLARPPVWGALVVTVAFAVGFTVSPSNGASNVAPVFAGAMGHPVPALPDGRDVTGTPAVGALFTVSGDGGLGSHFCTASVVDSPNGDLLITAAHCVSGVSAGIAFVPGYDGEVPYGVWRVTAVYVDASWSSSSDPDDDVAFLRVGQPGSSTPIEDVTGGEQLEANTPARQFVEVIGYPDSSNQAISCRNWTREPMPDQLEFDCGGYTDGTSGGPFLADVNPLNGQGTVIGVIGGYEQGGLTPQVSYSAMFGANVAALYEVAVAGG